MSLRLLCLLVLSMSSQIKILVFSTDFKPAGLQLFFMKFGNAGKIRKSELLVLLRSLSLVFCRINIWTMHHQRTIIKFCSKRGRLWDEIWYEWSIISFENKIFYHNVITGLNCILRCFRNASTDTIKCDGAIINWIWWVY